MGQGVHKEDILCMANQEQILASGSYDGDVVLWNLDVDRPTLRLNAHEEHCGTPSTFSKQGVHSRCV